MEQEKISWGTKIWAFVCHPKVRLCACCLIFGIAAVLLTLMVAFNVLVLTTLGFEGLMRWGVISVERYHLIPFVWALTITAVIFSASYSLRWAYCKARKIAAMSEDEFTDELLVVGTVAVIMLILAIFVAGIYQIGCWLT